MLMWRAFQAENAHNDEATMITDAVNPASAPRFIIIAGADAELDPVPVFAALSTIPVGVVPSVKEEPHSD